MENENKNNDYSPISCSYYDELEALATTGETCLIVHKTKDEEKEIHDRILDFKIINKAEYMLLEVHDQIRLDHIISVNGKYLWEGNHC